MNIKELKEIIKDLDDGLIISVDGYEGGVTDKVITSIEEVKLNLNSAWYYGEHEVCERTGIFRLLISRLK